MNQSLPELMDEILKQISEQFEAAVEKLTKRLADLTATKEKQNTSPTLSTDTLDGTGSRATCKPSDGPYR